MPDCEHCYWFESNGLEGEDAACACRSPKWEWTEEETEKWQQESIGKEFAVRSDLPDFDPEKHCDYRFCELGKSFVDIEYGCAVGDK